MSITDVTFVAQAVEDAPEEAIEGRSQWALTWRRLKSDRIAMASIGVIVFVILAAIFAPVVAAVLHHGEYQPFTNSGTNAFGQPVGPGTHGFPLGTDFLGRDLLVRILYGARISLEVGILTTLAAAIMGTSIGLVAGYFGGWVDNLLMRIVDLFFAFPFLVLIIAIIAMLGPSIFNMFVAIWITSWVAYARIMRAQTVVAKRQQYVLAARALGYGHLRVMFRHILPNTASAVIVFSMVDAVGNIILAASLGFLGLGAQPPSPEWGTMISDGQNYILTAWWLTVFPGLAVVFVGIAFSLIGDGLADLLRPGDQ